LDHISGGGYAGTGGVCAGQGYKKCPVVHAVSRSYGSSHAGTDSGSYAGAYPGTDGNPGAYTYTPAGI